MKVLFSTPELSPIARTGGLGEAVAGLSAALARAGIELTVALPRYRQINDIGQPAPNGHWALDGDGYRIMLIDDPPAFDRPGIYGPTPGSAYDDEWWRWGRFSMAIRELAPGYDLVHVHDGHAGPALAGLTVKTALTVHNPAYSVRGPLDLAARILEASDTDTAPGGALEWFGEANYLKMGVAHADRVTTVSHTFANQLLEEGWISGGMDGVFRSLETPPIGILNGIDTSQWDPATDPLISAFSGPGPSRRQNRAALLDTAGIDDGFVIGNVGRMAGQKGLDLLEPRLAELVAAGARFVFVGNGELTHRIDDWNERHPRAVAHRRFDDAIARLTYAGSDAFVMPSLFEPCGIGQMYAMAYGCPPIVRLTGGLSDTVTPENMVPGSGTGFGFVNSDPDVLAETIFEAMAMHSDRPAEWEALQERGMRRDFSWDKAAVHYLALYEEILAKP